MADTSRKVVLGLGNILYGDEGCGRRCVAPADISPGRARQGGDHRRGGTMGLKSAAHCRGLCYLLVLDTINAGKAPGTLIELRGEEIPLYAGIKLSEHQVTFQEVLGLATLRGKVPPHLHLVGVQPQELAMRIGLTPVVAAAVPHMVERSLAVPARVGIGRLAVSQTHAAVRHGTMEIHNVKRCQSCTPALISRTGSYTPQQANSTASRSLKRGAMSQQRSWLYKVGRVFDPRAARCE